jgi:hypothetical protein
MAAPKTNQETKPPATSPLADVSEGNQAQESPAWEEIDAGRYRPRRIRGSCRGRELG